MKKILEDDEEEGVRVTEAQQRGMKKEKAEGSRENRKKKEDVG